MRIAVSGIAWDTAEDVAVAQLLARLNVDAIDIAPGKYFPDPRQAPEDAISDLRRWWSARGIEITGMQALLFGTTGLGMFGASQARVAMLERLFAICRIGGLLGATRLVFGSPAQRDRGTLDDIRLEQSAIEFFRRLGDHAALHGVVVCLEPCPPRYGGNFMTNSAETARIVECVGHPSIRMQIDTGAMSINAEDPFVMLARFAHLAGHVHASEPGLVTLGDGAVDHAAAGAALARYLPQHLVAVEMNASRSQPHLDAIERAVRLAQRHYAAGGSAIGSR